MVSNLDPLKLRRAVIFIHLSPGDAVSQMWKLKRRVNCHLLEIADFLCICVIG